MPYFRQEQVSFITIITEAIKQPLMKCGRPYWLVAALQFGAITTEPDDFTKGNPVPNCQINFVTRFHNQNGKSSLPGPLGGNELLFEGC